MVKHVSDESLEKKCETTDVQISGEHTAVTDEAKDPNSISVVLPETTGRTPTFHDVENTPDDVFLAWLSTSLVAYALSRENELYRTRNIVIDSDRNNLLRRNLKLEEALRTVKAENAELYFCLAGLQRRGLYERVSHYLERMRDTAVKLLTGVCSAINGKQRDAYATVRIRDCG